MHFAYIQAFSPLFTAQLFLYYKYRYESVFWYLVQVVFGAHFVLEQPEPVPGSGTWVPCPAACTGRRRRKAVNCPSIQPPTTRPAGRAYLLPRQNTPILLKLCYDCRNSYLVLPSWHQVAHRAKVSLPQGRLSYFTLGHRPGGLTGLPGADLPMSAISVS